MLPFVALLSSVIGTDGDPIYDTPVADPPAVCESAVFFRQVLEDYAKAGRPLWPPVPSSLYDSFTTGQTGDAWVVTIT